jgi:hypothetical protein
MHHAAIPKFQVTFCRLYVIFVTGKTRFRVPSLDVKTRNFSEFFFLIFSACLQMMLSRGDFLASCIMQILLSRPVLRISPRYLSTASSKPVRWGILSAGKISSDYAKAIAMTQGAIVGAVAARSSDKAEEFANLHDIPKSYGSYAELLSDPDIDVVYVGSIADHHFPLAAQSILAGKPTVVEKPLTLNYKDTKSLVQLARKRDVFLMYVTIEMGFGLAVFHSLLTFCFSLGKEYGLGVFQP